MNASERLPIALDLQALEEKLRGQGAEAIARQRAQYFAERQLWADVLQEVCSVENPSVELQQSSRAAESRLCRSTIPDRR